MLEEDVTTRYHVGFGLAFKCSADTSQFDALLDRFYRELLAIEEREGTIVDPDLAASLRDLTASVEMLVDADDPVTANLCALTAIRTALHTVEVGTPGWELAIASITAETRSAGDMLQDA
jgi:hypothetical protein